MKVSPSHSIEIPSQSMVLFFQTFSAEAPGAHHLSVATVMVASRTVDTPSQYPFNIYNSNDDR